MIKVLHGYFQVKIVLVMTGCQSPGQKTDCPGEHAVTTGDNRGDLKQPAEGEAPYWTRQPVPIPAHGNREEPEVIATKK